MEKEFKPFIGNEEEFCLSAEDGFVMTINTADFSFCAEPKSMHSAPTKCSITGFEYEPTSWLTLGDVISRINEWINKGFRSDVGSNTNKFANRYFKVIQIHKTSKGYLWCNDTPYSFPNRLLDRFIIFKNDIDMLIAAGKQNADRLKPKPVVVHTEGNAVFDAVADASEDVKKHLSNKAK